jgi:hypothetical protein
MIDSMADVIGKCFEMPYVIWIGIALWAVLRHDSLADL